MLSFLTAVALCLCAPGGADDLIPRHGEYSQAYQSDWSKLPTGKQLAQHDRDRFEFTSVNGEDVRRVFQGEEEVRLSGERLQVHWAAPECRKYPHTLYLFQDCEKIVIEDMAIVNTDADFRASSVFLFEACGKIEIRDCHLAGACGKPMIRLEGCEEYFIDRVEISGVDHPGVGMKSGPGIFINNGAGWDEEKNRPRDIYAEGFRELKWGAIQNSYIHGHPNLEPDTNHDGILYHAPADGTIFNCVFEDYEGDSCLDISHRRNDPGYQDHHFRIERCIFENCHRVKTNGAIGSANCSILWCNNLHVNSMLTDYHVGWPNWHVHETFINDTGGGYFLTMLCRDGATLFRNCLMHCPQRRGSMYEPWGREGEDDTWIQPDHFMYFMPPPAIWLRPRRELGRRIRTWDAWREAGFDSHSTLTEAEPRFVDPASRDYRLREDSPAAGAGTADMQRAVALRQAVRTDFFGTPRPEPPSVGAFEVVRAEE